MNTNKRKTLLATFVALFAAGATTQGAMAQTESATEQSRIDEIIVTASKRATSLQDTALSVSAITGADLSKLGITNYDQILSAIPGVTIIEGGPGNSSIRFRGIGGIGGTSTSAFYIDDFPLSGNAFGNNNDIKLIDMAQIEVLKGPQGTLYGQSALGGVIRYMTNKPNFETIEGGVDITYEGVAAGDAGYEGQGHINIPLSENLAIRGVFYNYDKAGFIDNRGTGTKDVNNEEVTGGRLALRWAISDRALFDLLYLNQATKIGGGQANLVQTPSSTFTPVLTGIPTDIGPVDLDNPSFHSNFDPSWDSDTEVLNLKLGVNFEHFDLSIMGATKHRETLSEVDTSPWLGLFDDVTTVLTHFDRVFETDTFEARLVSTGDGPLEWIAGVWYEDHHGDKPLSWQIQTPRTGPVALGLSDGDFFRDRDAFEEREELSVYGEVGYSFTDQAKLTLGYRRSDLKQDSGLTRADGVFDGDATATPPTGAAATIGVDESTQEGINTYKINFEYRFNDDILAYALASSGYRLGGWNRSSAAGVSAASAYETDTLWNYEIGTRTSWLDNRLTANAVVYYIDWSEIQLRTFDLVSLSPKVQNVGEAEVFGLETEIDYQVTEGLNLSANYAYTDASLVEDYIITPPTVAAAKGTRLPGSSRHSFSLFVDWQRPLTSGADLLVNATYRYVSSRANGLVDSGAVKPLPIPSTDVVNLSAGISYDSGVTMSLFANNLFDERAVQTRVSLGSKLENVVMTRPRTIGLRLGYRF